MDNFRVDPQIDPRGQPRAFFDEKARDLRPYYYKKGLGLDKYTTIRNNTTNSFLHNKGPFYTKVTKGRREKMKHGKLSAETLELIKKFQANGILQTVDTHRLDQKNGAIIVSCADGDQIHDLFHYHERLFNDAGIPPRIHTLALNGGALLLANGNPLNTWLREDEVLLQYIGVARKLKEIDTVVLYAHIPCGAADMHQMSSVQVLENLMRAKTRLLNVDDKIKVACFCHIDYGDGKKRTYFFSSTTFNLMRAILLFGR